MRMKEVCERTGLTDRAVRLYIDSGLLQPKEESNYSGRRSIHFSEADVAALEAIATLRRADFSITDIRDMQKSPDNISAILDSNKKKLESDIESKKQILQSLSAIDTTAKNNYTDIAELLRRSASRNILPKEDSGMNFKDFQQLIKNRIFSVLAFALLLAGVAAITPLIIQAAFAEQQIFQGGGYTTTYNFTSELFFKNIQLFASELSMVISAVLLLLHIIKGKKGLLIAGCLFSLLSIATLLLLPAEIKYTLYRFEFLSYRHSFMWHILYSADTSFDIFIQSLKFIPPVAATLLTAIGLIRHKDMPDNTQDFI